MRSGSAAADPASRFAVGLQEFLLRDGIALERILDERFWRDPHKGDLAEAIGRLPSAAGDLTAFARSVTLEGLWACLKESPERATLRSYFAWAASERVDGIARCAHRASVDVTHARSEVPPANLERLPGGLTIWRSYVAAVRLEFRRQQASFDMWARAIGLFTHTDHGVEIKDPLRGWKPQFHAAGLLVHQRDTYRAAGQRALDILRAEARSRRAGGLVVGGDFSVDDPKLQNRIDALLLDRVAGIDETTADILRSILSGDGTIAEQAQAIDEAWDQSSLVRGITIASTEMARASALAEVDTYRENGVGMVEFSGGSAGDICDEYLGEQFAVDSDEALGLIPVHPNCTHYWAPVIPDVWNIPTVPWAGGELEPLDLEELGAAGPEEMQQFVEQSPGFHRKVLVDHAKYLTWWRSGLGSIRERAAAAAGVSSGVMLAFWLPLEAARQLTVPGGVDPAEMHLTLAYLGTIQNFDEAWQHALLATVTKLAVQLDPIEGQISGIGRFTSVPEGEPHAVYASFDASGLPEWRQELVDGLRKKGFAPSQAHGFTPHITVAWVDADKPTPCESMPPLELRFDTLTLALGGRRVLLPLGASLI